MKRKDKEFLQKIDRNLTADLPVSLSKENMEKLLQSENVQNEKPARKSKKAHSRRVAYFAAAAAAICLTIVGVTRFGANSPKPEPNRTPEPAPVHEAADYAEVEAYFLNLKELYSKDSSHFWDAAGDLIWNLAGNKATYTDGTPTETAPETGADSHGTTNVQVAGVDEADILKNDGRYLYSVSQSRNTVSILKTDANGGLTLTARIRPEKDVFVRDLYVEGNRLVLIVCKKEAGDEFGTVVNAPFVDCCTGLYNQTGVLLYDIENRAKPVQIGSYFQDGAPVSTRLSENRLLLLTAFGVDLSAEADDLKKTCVPQYILNGTAQKFAPREITVLDGAGNSYLLASSLDIAENKIASSCVSKAAVLGGSAQVYCDGEVLLAACAQFDRELESTKLYRFDLSDGKISYKASGDVNGTVLNQFSMDRHKGYFRVAATDRAKGCSSVTVLDENLKVIGTRSGIAPNEQIYAARFMGDTAYLVTFRRTDPLFVIDLSDPKNPRISGEVKIPGFSEYLHPWGDGFVIGVGEDGNENGSNGRLKVSLFDVRDPQNPKEVSKLIFEGDSRSAVQGDARAFLQFGNEFVLPIDTLDTSKPPVKNADGSYSYPRSVYLARISVKDGKLHLEQKYKLDTEESALRGSFTGNILYLQTYTTIASFRVTESAPTAVLRLDDNFSQKTHTELVQP